MMEIIDVVRKLVGPVQPIGDSDIDRNRFENLKELTSLVEELVGDIRHIVPDKNREEHSLHRAGEYSFEFIKELGIKE